MSEILQDTTELSNLLEVEPDLKNLDLITFTGLDYLTQFDEFILLSQRYPRVEFAVLLGSRAGQTDARRYPDEKEVKFWRAIARKSELHSLAIHLCGRYARAALGNEDNLGDRNKVLELCRGFNRIQINAQTYEQAAVIAFAEDAQDYSKIILQKRQPFEFNWLRPDPRIEYLFDLSGGQGLDSLKDWPEPDLREFRSGYAGGLNLENIKQALDFVRAHPQQRFWLDMESGVRTGNDWLDLGVVRSILTTAFPND